MIGSSRTTRALQDERTNMNFFLRSADRRPALRRDVRAGGARLRADLQGLRRVQLRPGRDGVLRRADLRRHASTSSACRCGWRSPLTMAVMVAARPGHRTGGAAPAGQPAGDHAVHGHHRPGLLHRRPGAAAVGRAGAQARPAASRTCRSPPCWTSFNIVVSQFDVMAAGICARAGDRAGAAVLQTPRSAARCARWPTTTRRRWRSAFRCSTSGPSSGRWPASSRWSPACCGARATACSSR